MTDHKTNLLFCDLKTDEEKASFFLSGRGYASGVIALSIQNDVAMAYHRCSEYRKEVEALQAECEKLCKDAERYRWLRDKCDRWDGGLVVAKVTEFSLSSWSGDDLDGAIDEVMEGANND